MAHIKKKPPEHVAKLLKGAIIKLDLGAGENQQEGFINIDCRKLPGIHIVHDLETQPWPLPSECASLVLARHLVEHINPAKGGFLKFMDECWRVLKYDGQLLISTPYAGGTDFWSDPTHVNGCVPKTFDYFDPLSPGGCYAYYKPKPWKIANLYFQANGGMEVLLEKRRLDPSYLKMKI
jgi:SAM-dependent methyltransferase